MARFLTRLAFALAAILIASIAFIGAVVFLFDALYLYFVTMLEPWVAALATCGVLIVFALLVLVIGGGLARSSWPASSRRARESGDAKYAGDPLFQLLGREIGGLATQSPYLAIGAALLAGVVFGMSPRLRGILADLFRRRR